MSFFASVVAPPFSDAEPVSVFAPFTFTGVISGGPDARFPLHLLGQGRMQVDFVSNPFIPVWEPPRAVLQFETSEPIPEPATLVLVGSGIAGCLMRRRRTARGAATMR